MAAPAQSVIDGLRANRERFEAFCNSLSQEELETLVPPDNAWTVKDFIIHLVAFDDLTAEWAENIMAGDLTGPSLNLDGSPYDMDAWNNQRVAEWRGQPLAAIFEACRPERERFIATLGKLSEEDMKQVVAFPGDNKRDPAPVPFGLFLQGLVSHDPVHVADIVKALPTRLEDPELVAWLDDRMVHWYQQAMAGPAKR